MSAERGERALLRETAADIFAAHCDLSALGAADGWLPAVWAALEESGFTAIGVPESCGGSGGDFADAAVVLFEAGRHAAPIPLAEVLIAGCALAAAGRAFPSGVVSFGHVEDGLAEVPWGRFADHVVLVRSSDAGGGIVDVAAAAPQRPLEHRANLAGEPRDLLVVAQETRESAEISPAAAEELVLRSALARTLQLAGCLQTCVALSVQYAQERFQFGRAIGRFQAVQEQLAEMTGHAAAASAAAFAAAEAVDADVSDAMLAVAAAKVRVSAAAGTVCRRAHQIHGAIGMTDEHRLHHFTTRAWAWRDEYGTQIEWSQRLGALVVAGGADALWGNLTGSAGG